MIGKNGFGRAFTLGNDPYPNVWATTVGLSLSKIHMTSE